MLKKFKNLGGYYGWYNRFVVLKWCYFDDSFLEIDIKLYDKYCHYFLTDNWCCNIGSGFLMWYKVRWGGNEPINKGHQD